MSVQLVVEYSNHQFRYYPANEGWRVDAPSRCIVIGKFPRKYIPLDGVLNFSIEKVEEKRKPTHIFVPITHLPDRCAAAYGSTLNNVCFRSPSHPVHNPTER